MALFGKKKQANDASVSGAPASDASVLEAPASSGNAASADDVFLDEALAPDSAPVASAKGYDTPSQHRAAKKGTVVGLNIGSHSIKAVELRGKGGDLTVTALGMVPTPSESIANGVVMSASAIVRAVRELFAEAGIKSKQVVASISGTNALVVRVIEVPKMSDAELKDNLAMDADRYIPFPAAEVVMDHQALRELPSDPDSPNMEVLLAAAQSEVVDSLVKVLQDAKLDPQAIDVEPLAAARALLPESGAADYNDVMALINIGAAGTEISVLRGDVLVFTRTVPGGGSQITEALVDYLGLPWQEAERLKCESADALPPAGADAASTGATSAGVASAGTASTGAASDMGEQASFAPPEEADWGDFDAFESTPEEPGAPTPAPAAPPVAEAPPPAAPPPPAGEVTADPFDLDFFDQGPQTDEPSEQHGQKEHEPDAFSFSFDAPENDEAQGDDALPARAPAPASPEPDDELSDLPAISGAVSAEPANAPARPSNAPPTSASTPPDSAPTISSAFDFSFDAEDDWDDLLPSVAGEGTAAGAPGGATEATEDEAASPIADFIPAAGSSAAPQPAPAPSAPVPSAPAPSAPAPSTGAPASAPLPISFAFEGDEPPEELPSRTAASADAEASPLTVGELGLEESESEGELPAKAGEVLPDFSFGEPKEAATEAATESAAPVSPPSGAGAEAKTDDDFDLDALLGAPAAPPATPVSAPDATTPSVAAPSVAAPGEPVLSGVPEIGAGVEDEASLDFDLETFGAGLADDGGMLGAGVDAATLYSLVHPVLDNLVGEVRRSLEYHASRAPDAPVRRIVLVGGGAKLKNIDAYFTQALGLPATIGDPLAHVTVDAPRLNEEYVRENSPVFAIALGLALRELI